VDPQTAALGAIIGIIAGLIICVIALIIFVIVFCNFKIKDDTNIRKRLITNDMFDEEKAIVEKASVQSSFTFFTTIRRLILCYTADVVAQSVERPSCN